MNAIRSAQAPEKFTYAFLTSLEYKSSSDRLILGVLKALGFLDDGGRPTDRYFSYLDQTQSEKIITRGIREAYADLFQVNTKAHNLSKKDVINKFKTLSQGKFSDSVLDKMAQTFTHLVKLGDFAAEHIEESEDKTPSAEKPVVDLGNETNALNSLGGLVYNIQLVLPESRDPAVYDAFFEALRKHLP